MFLYFCLMSVLGKIFEIFFWHLNPTTIIPFAQPYGFGAIAVIMFVAPLIRKKLVNPFFVYILNTIAAALVEYLSAVVVVLIYGQNIFWDYSNRILNLNGYICFEAAVLFGLLATMFIYLLYPLTERLYKLLNKRQIQVLLFIISAIFISDIIYSSFLE